MVKSFKRIVLTVLLLPVLALGQTALGGLVSLVPEGLRPTTIRISPFEGKTDFIRRGNAVDVVLNANANGTKIISILRNVPLLAESFRPTINGEGNRLFAFDKTVTLLITPQDAEKLIFLPAHSRLSLRELSPIVVPNKINVSCESICFFEAVGLKHLFGDFCFRSTPFGGNCL